MFILELFIVRHPFPYGPELRRGKLELATAVRLVARRAVAEGNPSCAVGSRDFPNFSLLRVLRKESLCSDQTPTGRGKAVSPVFVARNVGGISCVTV